MQKVMDAYATNMRVDVHSLRFMYDGEPVEGDDTAISLGLEDGDIIEAFLQLDWDFLPGETGDPPPLRTLII